MGSPTGRPGHSEKHQIADGRSLPRDQLLLPGLGRRMRSITAVQLALNSQLLAATLTVARFTASDGARFVSSSGNPVRFEIVRVVVWIEFEVRLAALIQTDAQMLDHGFDDFDTRRK
jgi:hypothetical protein